MFNPKYRILITSKCFPKDGVISLGTQLISIVSSIEHYLMPHLWYGADVDAVGKGARKYGLNNIQLNKIGSDLQFIEYCSEIEQFIWGVFLCIDKNFSSQNFQGIELETEDEPFRPINAKGIVMEIRTFDTTYFELYSEDEVLINELSKMYDVNIEKTYITVP
jgi:hypothetical protein